MRNCCRQLKALMTDIDGIYGSSGAGHGRHFTHSFEIATNHVQFRTAPYNFSVR